MKGYKAFKKGLICDPTGKNPFQFAENTVFEQGEEATVCESGFHFCENPLDTLDYYPLIDENGDLTEFAEVEALDEVKTAGNKSVTRKLKVGVKLNLAGFIKASIDFMREHTTKTRKKDYSQLAASGDGSQLAALGDGSQLAASGSFSKLAASGVYSQLAASGSFSKLAALGDFSKLAVSGNFSKLAVSGNFSKLAVSGNCSQLAALGNYSQLAASGDGSQLVASGKHSVIMCSGRNSKAKAKKGSWITLAEWQMIDDKLIPVCVKTEQVDGERIKEDVFYTIKDGEFVEVPE